jgi:hypothetical protein
LHQDRLEFTAGLRRVVLEALGPLLVGAALQHVRGLQRAQPLGEHVAGRPGVRGDVGEPVHTQQHLAQDEQ